MTEVLVGDHTNGGSYGKYTHGCRCFDCRDALNAYRRALYRGGGKRPPNPKRPPSRCLDSGEPVQTLTLAQWQEMVGYDPLTRTYTALGDGDAAVSAAIDPAFPVPRSLPKPRT